MATGRLGALDVDGVTTAVNTPHAVYTVPAGTKTHLNATVCNRSGIPVEVRLALVDGAVGALADEDYVFYDTEIPANGLLRYDGVVLQASATVVFESETADVNCVIVGTERAA